jgi:hypothetical protein
MELGCGARGWLDAAAKAGPLCNPVPSPPLLRFVTPALPVERQRLRHSRPHFAHTRHPRARACSPPLATRPSPPRASSPRHSPLRPAPLLRRLRHGHCVVERQAPITYSSAVAHCSHLYCVVERQAPAVAVHDLRGRRGGRGGSAGSCGCRMAGRQPPSTPLLLRPPTWPVTYAAPSPARKATSSPTWGMGDQGRGDHTPPASLSNTPRAARTAAFVASLHRLHSSPHAAALWPPFLSCCMLCMRDNRSTGLCLLLCTLPGAHSSSPPPEQPHVATFPGTRFAHKEATPHPPAAAPHLLGAADAPQRRAAQQAVARRGV